MRISTCKLSVLPKFYRGAYKYNTGFSNPNSTRHTRKLFRMTGPVEEFVDTAGMPTHVLKQGDLREGNEHNVLLLIIPGNPGVANYYEPFMHFLYKTSGGRLPTWCVSHAGHVLAPAPMKQTSGEDFFGLQGQVLHKILYVNEHIPPGTKLILVGHSIGCYIILRMLKELQRPVLKCLLLFPTIERMAESPKGRRSVVALHGRWLAPWLMLIPRYLIPASLKYYLVKWYFKGRNVQESAIRATLKLADPAPISCVVEMGHQEMQTVRQADYHLIENNLDKLLFYYGQSDHWCPLEYYKEMKARFPTADIRLCREGLEHAFVLESSEQMARWVWEWLVENVKEPKLESGTLQQDTMFSDQPKPN